jgi:putative hydrolase of the HAD superfamily
VGRRLDDMWHAVNVGALAGEALREEVCRRLGVRLDEAAFFELWSCHFRLHREVLPVVEALADQVALVLVSNTNARHFAYVRPWLPVLDRFRGLALSYELGVAKPDAAIFVEGLRRAGVAAAEAAFFDDVPRFVEAASSLGIQGRVFSDAPTFAAQLRALGLRA